MNQRPARRPLSLIRRRRQRDSIPGRRLFRRGGFLLGALLVVTLAAVMPLVLPAATETNPRVFVCFPDCLNTGIADLSGATTGVPPAPGWSLGASGGVTGASGQMRVVSEQIVGEMAAHGPQAVLAAGPVADRFEADQLEADGFDRVAFGSDPPGGRTQWRRPRASHRPANDLAGRGPAREPAAPAGGLPRGGGASAFRARS